MHSKTKRCVFPVTAIMVSLLASACSSTPRHASRPPAAPESVPTAMSYNGGYAYAPAAQPVAPKPTPVPQQQVQQAPLSAADAKLAEMNDRMVEAFDRIAAEYGNPSVIRVFSNDAEKAKDFQKRMVLLQRVEQLRLEAASLEKRVRELTGDVELRSKEAAVLEVRISQHRVALAAFVRMADEAEQAFSAISKADAQPTIKQGDQAQASPAASVTQKAKAVSIDPTSYNAH